MNDDIGKLYGNLQGLGYTDEELGDEENFRKSMSDRGKRENLYKYIEKNGNAGDWTYAQFEEKYGDPVLGRAIGRESQREAPRLGIEDNRGYWARTLDELAKEAPVGAGYEDEARLAEEEGEYARDYEEAAARRAGAAETSGAYLPEERGEESGLVRMAEENRRAAAQAAEEMLTPGWVSEARADRETPTPLAPAGKTAREFREREERLLKERARGAETFRSLPGDNDSPKLLRTETDPETGGEKKVWLTPEGYTTDNRAAAVCLTSQYNGERATLAQQFRTLGEQADELEARLEGIAPNREADRRHDLVAPSYVRGEARGKPDYNADAWEAARHHVENIRRLIRIGEKYREGITGIHAFGYGLQDALTDTRTWDFGLGDLAEAKTLWEILQKTERGEKVPREEQALLDAAALEYVVRQEYAGDMGMGYGSGQMMGEFAPVAAQFALNPLSGAGKGAGEAFAKYAEKKFAGRLVGRMMEKGLARATVKGAVQGAANILPAAAVANTSQLPEIVAGTLAGMSGAPEVRGGEAGPDGRRAPVSGGAPSGGESLLASLGKAEGRRVLGNWGMMNTGNVGEFGGALLKGVTPGRVLSMVEKWGANGAYRQLGNFLGSAGVHRSVPFFLSMEQANLLNMATVHDYTPDAAEGTGMFNPRRLAESYLGALAFEGAFAGGRALGYGARRIGANRDFNALYRSTTSERGAWRDARGRLDGYLDAIDSAGPDGAAAELSKILADRGLTREQKRDAMQLAGYRMTLRAMERVYDSAMRAETAEGRRLAEGMEKASREGAGLVSPEAEDGAAAGGADAAGARDAWLTYNLHANEVKALCGAEMPGSLDEDPLGTMQALRNGGASPETLRACEDYLNARAKVEGAAGELRRQAGSELLSERDGLLARSQEDGKIHWAALRGGGRVAVLGETEGSAAVMDADGNKRMVAKSDIAGREEPEDPAARLAEIAEELRKRTDAGMDRLLSLPFDAGDVYEMVMPDGSRGEVTVLGAGIDPDNGAERGDTVRVEMPDGTVQELSREYVRQQADRARLEDIANEIDADRARRLAEAGQNGAGAETPAAGGQPADTGQPTEGQTAETGQQPAQPTETAQPAETGEAAVARRVGDRVVLPGADGGVIKGEIEQETADGYVVAYWDGAGETRRVAYTKRGLAEAERAVREAGAWAAENAGRSFGAYGGTITIESAEGDEVRYTETFDSGVSLAYTAGMGELASRVMRGEWGDEARKSLAEHLGGEGEAWLDGQQKKGLAEAETQPAETQGGQPAETQQTETQGGQTAQGGQQESQQSALGKIPVRADGEPDFDNAQSAADVVDGLTEYMNGDKEQAKSVINGTLEDTKEDLRDAQKALEDLVSGKKKKGAKRISDPIERAKMLKAAQEAVDKARQRVDHWQAAADEVKRREEAETPAETPAETTAEQTQGQPAGQTGQETQETQTQAGTAETPANEGGAAGTPADGTQAQGAGTQTQQPAEQPNGFQYFGGSLSELVKGAKKKIKGLVKKVIAPISSRLRQDLRGRGIDVDEEYKHVVDNYAIRHILKQHGGEKEAKRGQIPLSESDFERISDVVENYDAVEVDTEKGKEIIRYRKSYADGTTIYVEEKRDKHKELAAVTMWKQKSSELPGANRTQTTQIPDLNGTNSGGEVTTNAGNAQGNGAGNAQPKTGQEHRLSDVLEMGEDRPSDARARGWRRVNGKKVERQGFVARVLGKAVEVKFSNDRKQKGHVALVEASSLQPSHTRDGRNPLHFLDEAQPKERVDVASGVAMRRIAESINPEEITGSVTAYTGAPSVNARGETIQGNNRAAALKEMWRNHPGQAERYRQYLREHAEEFGLTPEQVDAMENPVLVNMLEVDDADAIRLGQFTAADTETGGVERIRAKNAQQAMGGKIRIFAAMLMESEADEELSFSEALDRNAPEVLRWMCDNGFISPTQYGSAFDSRGNVTAEAKNDLRNVLYECVFEGANPRLAERFNRMPAKAQKAVLATMWRDGASPESERMIHEVQRAIDLYDRISQIDSFKKARTEKHVRNAVWEWMKQTTFDEETGETYLPVDKFSNFAVELATRFRLNSQKELTSLFDRIYDLVQGREQADMFDPEAGTLTLKEAIKKTLGIDYDGEERGNTLAGDNTAGEGGEHGVPGDAGGGEPGAQGAGAADGGGGAPGNAEVGGGASASQGASGGSAGGGGQTQGSAQGSAQGQGVAAAGNAEKIDDWGEELEGARKFALRDFAETMGKVSVRNLVAMPLGKVFPRRDFARQVARGKLSAEDATFLEALQALAYGTRKPQASARGGERKVAEWAEDVNGILSVMKAYCEAGTPEERRKVMETALSDADIIKAEDAYRDRLRAWNSGGITIGSKTSDENVAKIGSMHSPHPVRVAMDILRRLGYPDESAGKAVFPTIKSNYTGTEYEVRLNGGLMGRRATYGEALDYAVKLAKTARGDGDVTYDRDDFGVRGEGEMGRRKTGEYTVTVAANGGYLNRKNGIWGHKDFATREEAEKYAADFMAEAKEKKYRGATTDIREKEESCFPAYTIKLRDPLRRAGELKIEGIPTFETAEEAAEWMDQNMAELNERANETVAGGAAEKERRERRIPLKIFYEDESHKTMGVYYVNPIGMMTKLRGGFKSGYAGWQEAHDWMEAERGRLSKALEEREAALRELRRQNSFKGAEERKGADWRSGRDIAPEEFGGRFGFRGVQFGNWTNQAERQRAMNEAYDALMDLAETLGVSPEALSLNGELGIAFGSRGKGSANAHYEPDEVVINLTKTRGAGSLAHEWWHALDNYFSRRGGVSLGMLTSLSGKGLGAGVRPEVVDAYGNLVRAIDGSDYDRRSRSRGTYWGDKEEETARLFAEWVDWKLREEGKKNSFLASGVDERTLDKLVEANYKFHRAMTGGKAMTPEEFRKRPEAYEGWPEPLADEVRNFDPLIKALFDTIQEKREGDRTVLFSMGEDAPFGSKEEEDEAIGKANGRFNADLEAFKKGEGHSPVRLGKPSAALQASGLNGTEMYIKRSVLRDHLDKHGLTVDDIRDLPRALQNPLMVYEWGDKAKSLIAITEIGHGDNRITVAVKLERGGERVEVNEIASVHAKEASRFFEDMAKTSGEEEIRGKFRWVGDKKKALDWLGLTPSSPKEVGARSKEELPVAKVIENFENPKLPWEKVAPEGEIPQRRGGAGEDEVRRRAGEMAVEALRRKGVDVVTDADEMARVLDEVRKARKWRPQHLFAGEKGMANVDRAEATTRLDDLGVAREMERAGKDAKAVKLATGWERGADGKWRYEIPDFGVDMEALEEKPEDYYTRKRPLRSVLKGAEGLFEAYPELEKVRVRVGHESRMGTAIGEYNDKEKLITIRRDYTGEGKAYALRKVLIHEIQHAIQYIEGFAEGGNSGTRVGKWQGEHVYYNLAGEVEARNAEGRNSMRAEERRRSLAKETEDVGRLDQVVLRNGVFYDTDGRELGTQYLKTKDGEILGFVYGGKVYLDPASLDANTPVHEYTHLWDTALAKSDPRLWREGVELMRRTPLWERVKNDPRYRDIAGDENLLASEVHSRLTGEEGRKYFERLAREAEAARGPLEKARAIGLMEQLRHWLEKAMRWVRDSVFGKPGMTLEEFRDMPLRDLLDGGEKPAERGRGEEGEARFSVREGRKLKESEVEPLISRMEQSAEVAPSLELTPENWEREFGKDKTVKTPLGNVKLGENQYTKLASKGRQDYFGMIKPTLERPNLVFEEYDPKEGAERGTKYLFVKTFTKPDGSKVAFFESVTVKKDGLEVSISSHHLQEDGLKKKMQNDNILHLGMGLSLGSEGRLTETPNEGRPDLVPTSDNVSEGKGSENVGTGKGNGENSSDLRFSAREAAEANERAERISDEAGERIEAKRRVEEQARANGLARGFGLDGVALPKNAGSAEGAVVREAARRGTLRDALGEGWDEFLRKVYMGTDRETLREINELARRNGWNFAEGTERWLAGLSDNGAFERAVERGMWDTVKGAFNGMLREKGVEEGVGDNDARYALWRSERNKTESADGTILARATDAAKDYALGGDARFSAGGGDWDSPRARYRDGVNEPVEVAKMLDRKFRGSRFQMTEAWQDSMQSLYEYMKACMGKDWKGEAEVPDWMNPYTRENRLSSVNEADMDTFARKYTLPMYGEARKLARDERGRRTLNSYMMAKHGLERNARMAERAAGEAWEEARKAAGRDGRGRKLPSWGALEDDARAAFTERHRRDYAGLTGLFGLEAGEWRRAEEEARELVESYEASHDTAGLWRSVNAVTGAILDKQLSTGLISRETYDRVRGAYRYYVPLRGFDEATAEDVYAYLNHQRGEYESPLMRAEGRTSQAGDPFGSLAAMAQSAILHGNRNQLVKQAFYNFANEHPSDYVTESPLWVRRTEDGGWEAVFCRTLGDGDSPGEVSRKLAEFEAGMERAMAERPDMYARGEEAARLPYRMPERGLMGEHQVVARIGGRDRVLTVNGNPRLAQAINGQTNPDSPAEGWQGIFNSRGAQAVRFLSAVHTTWNPDFIISNYLRDLGYSNVMAWVKEGGLAPEYAGRFAANSARCNPGVVLTLLDRRRRGADGSGGRDTSSRPPATRRVG